MSRLIVTGASGFVGRGVRRVASDGEPLSLSEADWRARIAAADLRGASILHLGARAHAGPSEGTSAFADAPEKARVLAEAAATAGARVLVFASSIKVNGEESASKPFTAADIANPEDAYGRSKLAAETALREVSAATGLAVHIVRPPLVYGAGARGNLATLLKWCDSGFPMPFASVRNRRSFIALADLVALLMKCVERPMPGAPVWLAAHPMPVSTPELIREIRKALDKPARLMAAPPRGLEMAASVVGRGALMRRLTRSLELDASPTYAALDWRPRIDAANAIHEMTLARAADTSTR